MHYSRAGKCSSPQIPRLLTQLSFCLFFADQVLFCSQRNIPISLSDPDFGEEKAQSCAITFTTSIPLEVFHSKFASDKKPPAATGYLLPGGMILFIRKYSTNWP